MKYVRTNFHSFVKHKLNEKVNLKKKEEVEPIDDENEEAIEGDEDIEEPIEDEKPLPPVRKSRKKEDTIDEMMKEYRKLQIEWDNLFKDENKNKK